MNLKEKREVLAFTQQLAMQAGRQLLTFEKKLHSLKITAKKAQGVVSSADIAAEKLITKAIVKKYPDHSILAEEDAYTRFKGKRDFQHFQSIPYCWVIDPLDGTSNFLNGLDCYGVCIALVHYGRPIVGVVYRPRTSSLYYAAEGMGAFVQDISSNKRAKRLGEKRNAKALKSAMFATGFFSEGGKMFEKEFKLFKKIVKNVRAVRRFGSAAVDLCLLAEGIFDGFWECGLAPWDVAAAGIICEEANVKLTDFNGQPFHPFQKSILGARTPLYGKFIQLF